ncbi:hypothetical protein [Mycobacterium avium]|uniref:hypothetical protein n=1 Tax=Mycobacterium avium TaxID=1764 RepID=UPI001EDD557B|nr:hypothetical protein [Mycobacterium avium]MCG3243008.1 hypothetical protein [Mycobacterium avium subsp. hominissuis]
MSASRRLRISSPNFFCAASSFGEAALVSPLAAEASMSAFFASATAFFAAAISESLGASRFHALAASSRIFSAAATMPKSAETFSAMPACFVSSSHCSVMVLPDAWALRFFTCWRSVVAELPVATAAA